MYKKGIVLLLLLTIFVTGTVFAQRAASTPANWISGEVSLLGIGVRYEHMLTDNFSIGGNIFFHSFFFIWNSFGANFTGRWYPSGRIFYVEAGMGYGWQSGLSGDLYTIHGLMFAPGVGWRIDFGAPGGFFINPMISTPIVLGWKTVSASGWWFGYQAHSSGFGASINFKAALSLGFAF
ncbi:MAG: hypothetical protein LBI06_06185 [Treponema sp.]|jgi:hypothetical protein|nr:hypothetical protein [Treponema sp.]